MTTTLTSQGKAWVGAAREEGSSSLPPTIPELLELKLVNLRPHWMLSWPSELIEREVNKNITDFKYIFIFSPPLFQSCSS